MVYNIIFKRVHGEQHWPAGRPLVFHKARLASYCPPTFVSLNCFCFLHCQEICLKIIELSDDAIPEVKAKLKNIGFWPDNDDIANIKQGSVTTTFCANALAKEERAKKKKEKEAADAATAITKGETGLAAGGSGF